MISILLLTQPSIGKVLKWALLLRSKKQNDSQYSWNKCILLFVLVHVALRPCSALPSRTRMSHGLHHWSFPAFWGKLLFHTSKYAIFVYTILDSKMLFIIRHRMNEIIIINVLIYLCQQMKSAKRVWAASPHPPTPTACEHWMRVWCGSPTSPTSSPPSLAGWKPCP